MKWPRPEKANLQNPQHARHNFYESICLVAATMHQSPAAPEVSKSPATGGSPWSAARGIQAFHPATLLPAFVKSRQRVRDLMGLPDSLGAIGSLEIRIAVTKKDIKRAQKLRWRVFFEEGKAIPDRMSQLRRRDICAFDRICDHLIVIDHASVGRFGKIKPRVVGTYRLLRQDVADRHAGFYSATEFDISGLLERNQGKRFLELGRSCVLPAYRSRRTLELLWRGIWTYVRHHRIDMLIGCASLEGTNPLQHALPLSFLHHHASAGETLRAMPLINRHVPMDLLPRDAVDIRRAVSALPPLIKGYLRCGAVFGGGAVIDHQFGTTDVFVIMPVDKIDPRYIEYFSTAGNPLQAAA